MKMKMMKFLGLSLHSFHIHLSLGGDAALGVGDLDAESLGLGDDVDALAGGDGAGDPIQVISILDLWWKVDLGSGWTYSAA